MQKLIASTFIAAAIALSGCASRSPDLVSRDDAMRTQVVVSAVVESVRPVTIDGSQSGAGAATGAVIGGLAGSSVGGHREAIAIGVLGAVLGGAAGHATERFVTREAANEIIVRKPDGSRVAIVQASGNDEFRPGEVVNLISSSNGTRVVKASQAASR